MLAVIFFVMAGLMLATAALPHDRLWALRSWQYRDPEAHRPSPAAFRSQKNLCLLAGLICVGLGIYALLN
ncbi:hypothetical protein MTQ01_02465 [Streptomyces sp. XM4193]|uniref:hypothetical protein n=1 Tax=Streptomyces sp. XM4193 TaxID=2929782 RepID=UPI001FFBBA48|nr:hypothetical protein [Streptomyces sp. XM4193]MCK1794906.1 hypothetical protein [Streptomyces sp. XM4193]